MIKPSKPRAFAVAAQFGDISQGFIACCPYVANMPEVATANVVSMIINETGTKLPLIAVNATELTPEWLRNALAVIESAEKAIEDEKPRVVQLVSDNLRPADIAPLQNMGMQGDRHLAAATAKHSPLCPGRFGMFCTCGANARACETIWPGDGAA